ncbi:hypothetical protein PFLUV_G00271500 [Perca fluviatilis]|uniref:Uncharacterized protein n=1 Tax=Perca fluviatilis TaxID=8168 RepID=A0A6A5E7B7_PERFL|nr:hypothetical protein PFLUV_G00271500 [Perca fluviatilis]
MRVVGLICIPLVSIYMHPRLSSALQNWPSAGEVFHFRGRDIFYRTPMSSFCSMASPPPASTGTRDLGATHSALPSSRCTGLPGLWLQRQAAAPQVLHLRAGQCGGGPGGSLGSEQPVSDSGVP